MKIGIHIDVRNPAGWRQSWSRVYGFNLELCQEADRLGIDSVWLSEHHLFDDGYLPQPLTFAAAVAARTQRIRIGTAVLLAPFRSAAHLAEEAAVVDQLSDGRLDLGLGAGYRLPEFELFDADVASRFTETNRRARALRQIWDEGRLTPPPAQERLPIWLGYRTATGARNAGRLGEYLLSSDPALAEPYLKGLAEGGHAASSARMAGPLNFFVTDDPERDWPVLRPYHHYQWQSYREMSAEGTGTAAKPFDSDRARARGLAPGLGNILVDTPERVAVEIKNRCADAPIHTVFTWVSPGAIPEDMAMKHLRMLAEELAPRVADL